MKTKIKKVLVVFVASVFLVNLCLYAEAYHPKKGDKGYYEKGGKFEKFCEELGLTKEQEAQLKTQREEFKNKNNALRKKMRVKRRKLRDELEKPDVDRARVDTIIEELNDLNREKIKNRVNKILSMKNVLTPEQFKNLQDKMEKKHHDYRKRHDTGKKGHF